MRTFSPATAVRAATTWWTCATTISPSRSRRCYVGNQRFLRPSGIPCDRIEEARERPLYERRAAARPAAQQFHQCTRGLAQREVRDTRSPPPPRIVATHRVATVSVEPVDHLR